MHTRYRSDFNNFKWGKGNGTQKLLKSDRYRVCTYGGNIVGIKWEYCTKKDLNRVSNSAQCFHHFKIWKNGNNSKKSFYIFDYLIKKEVFWVFL